jgi:hypothetical protein
MVADFPAFYPHPRRPASPVKHLRLILHYYGLLIGSRRGHVAYPRMPKYITDQAYTFNSRDILAGASARATERYRILRVFHIRRPLRFLFGNLPLLVCEATT